MNPGDSSLIDLQSDVWRNRPVKQKPKLVVVVVAAAAAAAAVLLVFILRFSMVPACFLSVSEYTLNIMFHTLSYCTSLQRNICCNEYFDTCFLGIMNDLQPVQNNFSSSFQRFSCKHFGNH